MNIKTDDTQYIPKKFTASKNLISMISSSLQFTPINNTMIKRKIQENAHILDVKKWYICAMYWESKKKCHMQNGEHNNLPLPPKLNYPRQLN